MEIAITVIVFVAIVALWIAPSVIAIIKGHLVWGVLGLVVFAPIGWVGALLTAKPGSTWAKNRYSEDQLAASKAKYGDPAVAAPAAASSTAGTAAESGEDWQCGICGEVSATKVAAESHVRGSHPQAPVESSIAPLPQ